MVVNFDKPRICDAIKRSNYNDPRILMGNWYEEKLKFIKFPTSIQTIYKTDYTPPDSNLVSDAKQKKFLSLQRKIDQDKGPSVDLDSEYRINFATLYDLYYNRAYKGDLKDPANNYVNAVNYGLCDLKKQEWKEDMDESKRFLTENKRLMVHHNVVRYGTRRSSAKELPASVCRMLLDEIDFKTKEERICFCPEHPDVCAIRPRNPQKILPTL